VNIFQVLSITFCCLALWLYHPPSVEKKAVEHEIVLDDEDVRLRREIENVDWQTENTEIIPEKKAVEHEIVLGDEDIRLRRMIENVDWRTENTEIIQEKKAVEHEIVLGVEDVRLRRDWKRWLTHRKEGDDSWPLVLLARREQILTTAELWVCVVKHFLHAIFFFFFCVLPVPRRKCVRDRFRFPTV
jgi:hypothetical protein